MTSGHFYGTAIVEAASRGKMWSEDTIRGNIRSFLEITGFCTKHAKLKIQKSTEIQPQKAKFGTLAEKEGFEY